jgi:IS5 family transposase
MEPLSPEGLEIVEELARKYGVSTKAVTTLLEALISGQGTMAQFSHPELGGPGQWAQGGMTMIGDMFNDELKAKVNGLCSDLANLLSREPARMASKSSQTQTHVGTGRYRNVSLFVSAAGGSPGAWWGAELGTASATGSQNHIRYAYFPESRRLAVGIGDNVTIYDTADHTISGVSQQQSGDASLSFVSQRGVVRVADLRVVARKEGTAASSARKDNPGSVPEHASGQEPEPVAPAGRSAAAFGAEKQAPQDDTFFKLERLADLHKKGIVSDEEFAAKKAELLGRL